MPSASAQDLATAFLELFNAQLEYKLAQINRTITDDIRLKFTDVAIELFVADFCTDLEPTTDDEIGYARWHDDWQRTLRNRQKAQEWIDAVVEAFTFVILRIPPFPPGPFTYATAVDDKTIAHLTAPFVANTNYDFFKKLKPRLVRKLDKDEPRVNILRSTPLAQIFPIQSTFGIPHKAYGEHGALFAKSGHGKTQTLRTIIHGFLEEDDPPALFIMDSLGSLIEDVDRLAVFDGRLRDRLVILDPSDETPPALNFFKLQSDDLYFYLFKAIDQSFTPRQATMISYLMELMQHIEGANLGTLIEICEARDNPYPDVIAKLSPFAQSFLTNQLFTKKPDQLVQQTKNQIASRLYTLGRLPKFDQMFSAAENKFDPYQCIKEKKIVLINTDARPPRLGGLGEASSVLGRFLLAQILDAARSRPRGERHLALIIVDEAKHYLDEQAALILSDARQFGLGMLLATQFPHQIVEGVRREINTNTSIKLMGPVEYAVASQYARDMFTTPEFIMGMRSEPPRSAEWACHVSNVTHNSCVKLSVPFLKLESEPRMSESAWRAMRERNRERYGAAPKMEQAAPYKDAAASTSFMPNSPSIHDKVKTPPTDRQANRTDPDGNMDSDPDL